MITVRGDRVLVKPERQGRAQRESGVITLHDYEPDVMGTVIACGEGMDVRVDDVVVFSPDAGQRMTHEGTDYLVLQQDEILGVWE